MLIANARHYLLILALISVSGCGVKQPIIQTKPLDRIPLNITTPRPIETLPINWIIITKDNVEAVIEEQNKLGNSVFIALTPDGYKKISSNQAEILRFILQQQAVIAAYKDYYIPVTTPLTTEAPK